MWNKTTVAIPPLSFFLSVQIFINFQFFLADNWDNLLPRCSDKLFKKFTTCNWESQNNQKPPIFTILSQKSIRRKARSKSTKNSWLSSLLGAWNWAPVNIQKSIKTLSLLTRVGLRFSGLYNGDQRRTYEHVHNGWKC